MHALLAVISVCDEKSKPTKLACNTLEGWFNIHSDTTYQKKRT